MTGFGRIRFAMFVVLMVPIVTGMRPLAPLAHAQSNAAGVRSRMMEILNEVSDLVKENYYDPTLKNLDWKAGVEVARERIRRADHEGEMAAAIAGLLARLSDSHTYFLRPQRLQPVIFGFRAKAFGDDVRVYEVMRGGPAEEAGLRRGDEIIAVEDFAANRKIFEEEVRYFEYLDPRLTLKLKIVREGGPPTDLTINGKQPATSSKEFVKVYEEYSEEQKGQMRGGTLRLEDGGVGYLRFPSFMMSTSQADSLLKKAMEARSLILDLRDDGGGAEDTMKDMAGHFLSEPAKLMLAISRNKQEEIIGKPRNPSLRAPLFVLVDSHSASASEVLARVLQVKKRATIVGDVTAGRVNRARFFGGRGGAIYTIPFGVAITVSRAVMPDGEALEGHGVVPDVKCVPTEEDLRLAHDPCLDRALLLAREAASKMGSEASSQINTRRDEAKSPH
jgi:carboxyl-terminal processing protease